MTRKPRVLLIDDDPGLLRLIGTVFHKAGYHVSASASGHEGLLKTAEVKPDLIILDVMMPDMSGLEVCRRLRTDPRTARIPILMLSALGHEDNKVGGFAVGADDYVEKPAGARELLARAKALLNRASYARTATARTIAVVGAKGGVGVTTVAINLTAALAQRGHSAVMAELRVHRGNSHHLLQKSVSQDLGTLLSMDPDELDHESVFRRVALSSEGLRFLAAPQSPDGHPLTVAHVNGILGHLASDCDYLILDLPPLAGEGLRRATEHADQIILATEPEPLSVASACAELETLRAWELFDRVSAMVVTRVSGATLMSIDAVRTQLDVPVMATLPPAAEMFQEATRNGIPIVLGRPESRPARILIELADQLAQRLPAPERISLDAS